MQQFGMIGIMLVELKFKLKSETENLILKLLHKLARILIERAQVLLRR